MTGSTREETEQLIREAIAIHIEGMLFDNKPIPHSGAWTGKGEVEMPTLESR